MVIALVVPARSRRTEDLAGIFVTEFSHCYLGGRRTKWTTLVHNIPERHQALHTPVCPGHRRLLPYMSATRRTARSALTPPKKRSTRGSFARPMPGR